MNNSKKNQSKKKIKNKKWDANVYAYLEYMPYEAEEEILDLKEYLELLTELLIDEFGDEKND